jgi:ABC-type multidrug transport system ATPase subunit
LYAVEVESVTKKFSDTTALTNVSLKLKPNRKLILLGPNGAGKSTLLKIISGLNVPTKGQAYVYNVNTNPYSQSIGHMLSFVGENYALYDNLTVYDNLIFFSTLYGFKKVEAIPMIKELLDYFDASEYLNRKVGMLSRGTKQKIAICRALMNKPKVLLLDEPTAFLDARAAEKVHDIIESGNMTIIYATQRLDELYRINGNIMLLNNGKITAQGNLKSILSKLKDIEVEAYLAEPLNAKALSRLQIWNVKQRELKLYAKMDAVSEIPDFVKDLVKEGAKVLSISYVRETIGKEFGGKNV